MSQPLCIGIFFGEGGMPNGKPIDMFLGVESEDSVRCFFDTTEIVHFKDIPIG